MTTIPIPPEAIEAAAKALHEHDRVLADDSWESLIGADQDSYRDAIRDVLPAALSVGEVREQRDCPGEDCRRHRFGQHKLIRTVVTWPDGTVITTAWRNVDE